MTSPRIALLALVVLAAAPLAALGQSSSSASTAPAADAWVITGHETCTEPRLVVGRDIRVSAGGVLDLQGCVLAMDSPPYNDTYFARKDEGLTLRVERGGLLRLHATPGHPAGIERNDSRYGYTIKDDGDLESVGLPDAPNRIAGLEGAHEGQLALGGLQARGNVTLRHTRFEENFGPSLFLLGGARLDGDHVDLLGWGGLVATRAAGITLSNFTAHALNTPVAISLTPAALSDCRIDGGRNGLVAAQAEVTLRNCAVASNGTALSMTDGNVTVNSSDLSYKGVGIMQQHKSKTGGADTTRLLVTGGTVLGAGPNATSAILANQGTVEVRDSRLSSSKGPVINASLARLTVSGSRLEGPSAVQATDPYTLDVQGTTGPSPVVTVWRNTVVQVKDAGGAGVEGVQLGLRDVQALTNKDGLATLHWRLLGAEQVTSLDYGQSMTLSIKAPDGTTSHKEIQAGSAYVAFTLGQEPWWKSPMVLVLGVGALAVAVGLVVWSRRRKASP